MEEEGGTAVDQGDSECMMVVRFAGVVSKCITFSVHSTSCDRLRLLVERAVEEHVPASSSRLRLVLNGREVPDGTKSLAEEGLGFGNLIMMAELIASIDCGGGGSMQQFKSIPVEKLPQLIETIKKLFEEWKEKKSNPVYAMRFEGDTLAGKEVMWDGFSDPVKYFFEQTDTIPTKDFAEFYSDEIRTISASYVWKGTSLVEMAGQQAKKMLLLSTHFNFKIVKNVLTKNTIADLHAVSRRVQQARVLWTSCVYRRSMCTAKGCETRGGCGNDAFELHKMLDYCFR